MLTAPLSFSVTSTRPNYLRHDLQHLKDVTAETEPLGVVAPINGFHRIDPDLKFFSGVLFEQILQQFYLIVT